ncbi:MAG: hypothetical protein ACU85V_18870 [Gammaproteobacteria bacterium]
MKMTAEISMYPVRDDFLPPIDDFIAALNSYEDLEVTTTATATMVVGDYARVMQLLTEAIAESHRRFGVSVFVTKLIPGYEPGMIER